MDDKLKEAYALAQQMDDQARYGGPKEKEKITNFLNTLAMIESSGGKNFNHPTIESGIHEGHQAVGTYGLMPNTVNEVVNRMQSEGKGFPNLTKLVGREPQQIKAAIEQNPQDEQRLAEYLAKHVLAKQQGDEEKAAYSWFQGHNMTPERIEQQGYKDHDYVKKYNEFKNLMSTLSKPKE